jgi:putative ABC transport system ATP-binding protein
VSGAARSLEARGLRFTHAGGRFSLALDAFSLRGGEAVACVGPSGCGKTTLLELLVGIRTPDEGEVRFGGEAISTRSDAARRRWRLRTAGLVFQELQLVESLSGLENVLLPHLLDASLGDRGAARRRAEALAGALGVAHLLGRRIRRMSQGERQRLAVCRSLVTEAPLLVADEPTGSLDRGSAAAVVDLLLAAVREQGRALLMTTHDPSLLARFDRVLDLGALDLGGMGAPR